MAVAVSGFSTYSEMRSANWPAREIFLSGVILTSDQPIFKVLMGKNSFSGILLDQSASSSM